MVHLRRVHHVRITPGISCEAPKVTGFRQLHPFVGPLRDSPGEVLQPGAAPGRDVRSSLADATDELRVMC